MHNSIVRVGRTIPIRGVSGVKVKDCFRGLEADLRHISEETPCPKVTSHQSKDWWLVTNIAISLDQ